jgi:hypothetical protein
MGRQIFAVGGEAGGFKIKGNIVHSKVLEGLGVEWLGSNASLGVIMSGVMVARLLLLRRERASGQGLA